MKPCAVYRKKLLIKDVSPVEARQTTQVILGVKNGLELEDYYL